MVLATYVFLVLVGLLVAQEIFRRFPKFALIFFTALPISLVPYWVGIGLGDWFLRVKLTSIIVATIWLLILRLTNIGKNKFAKKGVYILLVINMLEAIARDVVGGEFENYLNAVAGILLLFTLDKIDSIAVTENRFRDIKWNGMTLAWVIGNTIWDWTFIYLNYVNVSAHHLAVLGAPLIIAFFDKSKWLQARAFTLCIYLIFFCSPLPLKSTVELYSGSWSNEIVGYSIAWLSFIFMAVYTVTFSLNITKKIRITRA